MTEVPTPESGVPDDDIRIIGIIAAYKATHPQEYSPPHAHFPIVKENLSSKGNYYWETFTRIVNEYVPAGIDYGETLTWTDDPHLGHLAGVKSPKA